MYNWIYDKVYDDTNIKNSLLTENYEISVESLFFIGKVNTYRVFYKQEIHIDWKVPMKNISRFGTRSISNTGVYRAGKASPQDLWGDLRTRIGQDFPFWMARPPQQTSVVDNKEMVHMNYNGMQYYLSGNVYRPCM